MFTGEKLLSEYLKPLGVRKLPKWDEEEFWLWDRLAEAINAEIARNTPEPITGEQLDKMYDSVLSHHISSKTFFPAFSNEINAHFLGKGANDGKNT